jgi:hypothetical protein
MKDLLRPALVAACVAFAVPAHAGELRLSIANGRVTLSARDVTVREILAEWARVGQTRIINAEKLLGTPVVLELNNVPEAQALDTLLRSAAGYVMAPRPAGTTGASVYDRILILATSRPPAVTASAPTPFNRVPPQIQPVVPDDDENDVASLPAMPTGPVMPPQGAQPGLNQQPQLMNGQPIGVVPPPNMFQQPGNGQQQTAPQTSPRPGLVMPSPTGPYVPQGQQPTTPQTRPGGGGGE